MRRGWVLAVACVVGAAVGAAGWWLVRHDQDRPRPRATPPPPSASAATPEVTDQATILIFKTYYVQCRQEATRVQPAGEEHAGLDRTALASRFPGWEVRAFSRGQVELIRSTDEPCPGASGGYTITLRDGRVVVLEGRGLAGPVVQRTAITADRLTPEERQLLEQGLQVDDLEAVRHVLESIEEASGPEGS